MIKSLYRLFTPTTDADYNTLVAFFDSLGLAHGEAWDGKHSKGVKLLAPQAGVEIGMGEGFPDADLVLEVDSADAVYEAIRGSITVSQEIADQSWGARLFTLDLPAGAGRLAIFSYLDQRDDSLSGKLDARGRGFGIVVGRFNAFITDRLLAGALDALSRCGAERKDIQIVRVPGAFEIPAAARMLATTGRVDAIICLGCIIRGQTSHYEHLSNEVTRGIGQSAQDTGVPHALGVLTCENLEQAIDRAGLKTGNKGFDAAMSAVEMASLRRMVRSAPPKGADVGRSKQLPVTSSRNHNSKKQSVSKTSPPRRSR